MPGCTLNLTLQWLFGITVFRRGAQGMHQGLSRTYQDAVARPQAHPRPCSCCSTCTSKQFLYPCTAAGKVDRGLTSSWHTLCMQFMNVTGLLRGTGLWRSTGVYECIQGSTGVSPWDTVPAGTDGAAVGRDARHGGARHADQARHRKLPAAAVAGAHVPEVRSQPGFAWSMQDTFC